MSDLRFDGTPQFRHRFMGTSELSRLPVSKKKKSCFEAPPPSGLHSSALSCHLLPMKQGLKNHVEMHTTGLFENLVP